VFDAKVKTKLITNLPQWRSMTPPRGPYDEYKGDQIPRAMVMSDAKPRDTKILDRGDYLSPIGEKLTFLPRPSCRRCPRACRATGSGLAKWLFLPEHPLTAPSGEPDVAAVLRHGHRQDHRRHGVQSRYPLHMGLLDWLAVEFRERRLKPEADAPAARRPAPPTGRRARSRPTTSPRIRRTGSTPGRAGSNAGDGVRDT